MRRRFVMGDVHGEKEALEEVFALSEFNFEEDELIQVGDLCDRGFDSYGCVELLKKVKNLIIIQGNHDIWFKDYMKDGGQPEYTWYSQGGKETLESYKRAGVQPDFHKEFYDRQVCYYIDDKNNCFVHGGFNREALIEDHEGWTLAWDRDFVNQMMSCKEGKLKTKNNFNEVYIGHTPTIYWYENEQKTLAGILVNIGRMPITKPIMRGGVINVDTGSGKGGKLTIMNIDTKEYFQSKLQVHE